MPAELACCRITRLELVLKYAKYSLHYAGQRFQFVVLWRVRLLDCFSFGPAYNLSDPVLVINTVNSAGEISKALWPRYWSCLSRQLRSGVPPLRQTSHCYYLSVEISS